MEGGKDSDWLNLQKCLTKINLWVVLLFWTLKDGAFFKRISRFLSHVILRLVITIVPVTYTF